jgi:predicted phage terminase large subunit-like protein
MFSKKLDIPTLKAIYALTILENPYIPIEPTDKQLEFLLNFDTEVLYGGAAGGGKSAALLMAALMFVEEPDYKALILRRTYSQLTLPGALMDMAHTWLANTDAVWCEKEKAWVFPSGATLTFGHLSSENDKYRYQGAEYHFIGFDELTQFTETQYEYLFSRMRKPAESKFPLRFRSASNPGGVGHEWVKARFLGTNANSQSKDCHDASTRLVPQPQVGSVGNPLTTEESARKGRRFIPANLNDNPYLDRESYIASLSRLDPVTRKQLEEGDWEVQYSSGFFPVEKFEYVDLYPQKVRTVRYWDLAGSAEAKGKDPDYTAGVKICMQGGYYWIVDVVRARLAPAEVEELIRNTAELDGKHTEIFMEQEPGSSGVAVINHFARNVLRGYCFKGVKSTGSKLERSKPFASAVGNGLVRLVRGGWNRDFVDECSVFPQKGFHDDMVDAASGAFEQLNKGGALGRVEPVKVDRAAAVTRGY